MSSRIRRAQVTIVLHPEIFAAVQVMAMEETVGISTVCELAIARYLVEQGRSFKIPLGLDVSTRCSCATHPAPVAAAAPVALRAVAASRSR